MARSRIKTPVFGNCCGVNTRARRKANQIRRRRQNQALAIHQDADKIPHHLTLRQQSDWDWPTDGRRYRRFDFDRDSDFLLPRWKIFLK